MRCTRLFGFIAFACSSGAAIAADMRDTPDVTMTEAQAGLSKRHRHKSKKSFVSAQCVSSRGFPVSVGTVECQRCGPSYSLWGQARCTANGWINFTCGLVNTGC